uniref:Lipid-binding serum glycoprotein C-terminal domain-containing protein n=1 Tax=Wuchereria bancrofti TaxID=6293 RepID=A0A1I8EKE2_WUCBA
MSLLPNLRIITGSSSTLYFILLILPSYAVGLTLEYVPDLAPTTRKNYEITSPEGLMQEKKGKQQDAEVSQSTSITDLFAKVGYESNVKFDDDLKRNVGMLIRITPRMINYWAAELKQMFQKKLENKELPEFSRTLMKLNVSILKPRIHNITFPGFRYKVQCNNTLEVILHGGSAQLSSSYRAVYRTIREGYLEANMSSFVITLKLKIATTFAGKLLLEDIVCGAEVRSIDIKLTPKLHELVDQGLRVELDETVSVVICEALEAFTNQFEERLNKLIRSPVVEIKINDTVTRLLIDTTISNDIFLTEDYFDFPLLGTPAIKKLEREAYLMKSPDDKVEMIYLYVSESVLNIFLKQLATFGDTALQLHADPEFQKILSLNCSENEKCMGDLLQDTELYVPDSGALFCSRMVIKISSPLVASVRNGFALIDLYLTSFVTYKEEGMDVKVLEFEWHATIHVSNEYLNEHLAATYNPVQNMDASLQVVNIVISNVTPYVELVSNCDEHLLRLISSRKRLLEKLLTQQCSLARTTSTLYKAVYCTATFRNGTLVIATGLQWNPELFYQFGLFS